ncbi:deoxyribodipyrimidine photo-lyase [Taibaiella lutea]|uniref:Deoxyribodipyrimidine photo-lyase n=1 Tax=Taibaiella lutea TaxID=2608001 RepID=A0A5M6CW03_9BACT|nr:deoxyribodipyrimidine photo-lyase [Taibaiella lutea]KAA5537095.1 deoxyribodipyrimidine photo-lyase [Taibaiella lutea]
MKLTIFWFRRDLRLEDNAGLYHALKGPNPVLPVFIFDTNILDDLSDKKDKRLVFIHRQIEYLQKQFTEFGSTLKCFNSTPLKAFEELLSNYSVGQVIANRDYEPYAMQRDNEIENFLKEHKVAFKSYKDQVIFDKKEIVKDDKEPYAIFTPYSRKWKNNLNDFYLKAYPTLRYKDNFYKTKPFPVPTIADLGFEDVHTSFPSIEMDKSIISHYNETRDIPGIEGTSKLGLHLRFGTISTRHLVQKALKLNETFLNELIWREFFMTILWHYPKVVHQSFRPEYENIQWRNNEHEFEAWCAGKTGYPIVDAGMRQLNATGFMHNRVRMITASFLCKHLLIDWRWGEAYFAKKLLDYDLAANNGNWQWAAGCGCDAAPYFRIFNPETQTKKFDPDLVYIRKWVPELETFDYPQPIVEHTFARERCLAVYKKSLQR